MKTLIRSVVVLFFFALAIAACSKPSSGGGGGGGGSTTEENLVIAIDPDPGSSTTPVKVTGATYNFNIVIKSAVPARGVDVKVKFTRDLNGNIIAPNDYTFDPSTTSIPVTISNIPAGEIGTVTITVTSKSKPTNTVTQTFKLVKK
ncbi:hypothetical protein [Flavisolibacter tropicus]|uniref:Uncharacterized protein n=1 Tax=Flavisolibacter tropicus TaxID=1492898 RepID=A0A172TYR7_9BACT|nr:hypothetical protein [Flavisolibacter tropicus]ANE52190.1 hypothetical protein SY85_18515 [Flavisolibacter tropicus]